MIKRLKISQDIFAVDQIQSTLTISSAAEMAGCPERQQIDNDRRNRSQYQCQMQMPLPGFLQQHVSKNSDHGHNGADQTLAQRSQRDNHEEYRIIKKSGTVTFIEIPRDSEHRSGKIQHIRAASARPEDKIKCRQQQPAGEQSKLSILEPGTQAVNRPDGQ